MSEEVDEATALPASRSSPAAPSLSRQAGSHVLDCRDANGHEIVLADNVGGVEVGSATPITASSSSMQPSPKRASGKTKATKPGGNSTSSSSSAKKIPKSAASLTKKKKTVKESAASLLMATSSPDDDDDDDDTTTASAKSRPTPSSSKHKSKHSKSYADMAHDAIVDMKDFRTGSSMIAIQKWILEHYPTLEDGKPFRSRLNVALKSAVKRERFCKLKNSYKIHANWKKQQQQLKRKKKAQDDKRRKIDKEKREEKRKEDAEHRQKEKEAKMTEEERAALLAKRAEQEEAVRLAKERAERLRKRRFPMEDTKLHAEDKELGVKAPEDVKKRQNLPYFFHMTHPFHSCKRQGRTPAGILAASKVEQLEHGSRGLVPDLLQVYHFFRGDVHFSQLPSEEILVPEFSLKQLVFAVDEVLNGNTKKSRVLPSLLSHLFVTCLRLLTSTEVLPAANKQELRLHNDLSKLAAGLSPASWAEVCFHYIDTNEHFYSSNASVDPNVLPAGTIDIQYLMRASDEVVPVTPAAPLKKKLDNDAEVKDVLPDGYSAYVGDPRSSLARAYQKLAKFDPWNLTAEELMAVLRALTDDILTAIPAIGEDVAQRDEEMYELLRAKRSAESHFRKIRLAHEGPKKPSRTKATKKEAENKENPEEASPRKQLADVSGSNENEDFSNESGTEKKTQVFKPTATKKQLDKATKEQQKAHDAYQKGLRNLVARTEPIGFDRHHNAIYYFNHDPDVLYVEIQRGHVATIGGPIDIQPNRMGWHVIETKSSFDDFVESLDIRGTRENDLYESMLGPVGGHYSLRRGLHDDIKEKNAVAARQKEKEELDRRLDNAKIAVDAEDITGRRSGRLQSRAQIDLAAVEKEIEELDKRIVAASIPDEPDYEDLTGLRLMKKFDAVGRKTRRSRELKALSVFSDIPEMPSTKLLPTGHLDGSGVVGMVVAELLEIEELCETLVPWERNDVSRDSWMADFEELVHTWNNSCPVLLGPTDSEASGSASTLGTPARNRSNPATNESPYSGSTDSKRRKLDYGDSPSSSISSSFVNVSPTQILSLARFPLLELEQRVFDITGLAMAARDADEADDNMSTTSDDEQHEQEQKEKTVWKKLIHSLRSTETRRHSQIREVVVAAITAARKAQLPAVVAKLRSALLLHHPNAAGECKNAAITALDNFGGYEEESDASDDESDADEEVDEDEEEVPSLLSGEAMMLTGSLDGDGNANRLDWVEAVRSCKTLSRWAALSFCFARHARKKLEKIQGERDSLTGAINIWKKEEERRARSRTGKTNVKVAPSKEMATEVWANVRFTQDFCMAKVEGFPFWPAKKCQAKDVQLANDLHAVGRMLVALVGENGGLRAVRLEDIRPFDGNLVDDELDTQPKSVRAQLDDCMATARRILRGRQKMGKNGGYVEEKKIAT